MEVAGGNARARSFFASHGWSDSDAGSIVSKYQSRAAELYRAQLRREANRPTSQTSTEQSSLPASEVAEQEALSAQDVSDEEERLHASAESSDYQHAEGEHANHDHTSGFASTMAKHQPSSARRTSVARRGAASGGAKSGLGARKLGASKVDNSVFEQPPANATGPAATPQSNEHIQADSIAEAATHASNEQQSQTRRVGGHVAPPTSSRFSIGWGELESQQQAGEASAVQPQPQQTPTRSASSQALQSHTRQQAQQQPQRGQPRSATDPGESFEARRRFGNAKSISSDSLFGGGASGAAEDTEASASSAGAGEPAGRLAQFQNATAISSEEFFGRDESKPTASDDPAEQFVEQAKEDFQTMREMAYEASNALSDAFSSLMQELSGNSRY